MTQVIFAAVTVNSACEPHAACKPEVTMVPTFWPTHRSCTSAPTSTVSPAHW
jgi:hypothetical protein